jgi:hypothetical protein
MSRRPTVSIGDYVREMSCTRQIFFFTCRLLIAAIWIVSMLTMLGVSLSDSFSIDNFSTMIPFYIAGDYLFLVFVFGVSAYSIRGKYRQFRVTSSWILLTVLSVGWMAQLIVLLIVFNVPLDKNPTVAVKCAVLTKTSYAFYIALMFTPIYLFGFVYFMFSIHRRHKRHIQGVMARKRRLVQLEKQHHDIVYDPSRPDIDLAEMDAKHLILEYESEEESTDKDE